MPVTQLGWLGKPTRQLRRTGAQAAEGAGAFAALAWGHWRAYQETEVWVLQYACPINTMGVGHTCMQSHGASEEEEWGVENTCCWRRATCWKGLVTLLQQEKRYATKSVS